MSDQVTPFAFCDSPRFKAELARLRGRRDELEEHLFAMRRRYYLRWGGFEPSFRQAILDEAMADTASYVDDQENPT